MTAKSYFRGHETYFKENKWYYSNDNTIADFTNIKSCKKCDRRFQGSNIGQADSCLNELPGVDNACCGHGIKEKAYIRFKNGVVIQGFNKVTYTEKFIYNFIKEKIINSNERYRTYLYDKYIISNYFKELLIEEIENLEIKPYIIIEVENYFNIAIRVSTYTINSLTDTVNKILIETHK